MDISLFGKYARALTNNDREKSEIQSTIEKVSGITVEKSAISITKKKVTLTVSSAIRAHLHTTKTQQALESRGYTCTY